MGQADARGTREQRIAIAIANKETALKVARLKQLAEREELDKSNIKAFEERKRLAQQNNNEVKKFNIGNRPIRRVSVLGVGHLATTAALAAAFKGLG